MGRIDTFPNLSRKPHIAAAFIHLYAVRKTNKKKKQVKVKEGKTREKSEWFSLFLKKISIGVTAREARFYVKYPGCGGLADDSLSYDSGKEAGPVIATSVSGCPGGWYPSAESFRTLFGSLERRVSAAPDFYAPSACGCERGPRDKWEVVFCGWKKIKNQPTAASMNNGSNRTIDPSCLDKPPLAMDIILSE